MKYDYLVVGSGLFGATFAYEASKRGKKVLVVEKRDHIGGNIFTEIKNGISVHKYGAHIFHTDSKEIWDYVNQFAEFNRYTNSPVARFQNEVYNLPFNMNTFSKIWPDVFTPEEAMKKIEAEKEEMLNKEPQNLEEQAIRLVGRTIYEKLVKGYTEKQWGKSCEQLPAFIIKRLPVRFTYDNNYFNDRYQGIPIGGYTQIIEKMLQHVDVKLNTDYLKHRDTLNQMAEKIIFTGMIDEYFHYEFGELEYRSLRFEEQEFDIPNYQGNAVVNYTESTIPYTRVIEHKHFEFGTQSGTIITTEYPDDWTHGKEAYYTINNDKNNNLALQYRELAKQEKKVIFGGRLAEYKYYDMDDVIMSALHAVEQEFSKEGNL